MAPRCYHFEVRLLDVKPAPWRRFLIEDGASFLDLHDAIQAPLVAREVLGAGEKRDAR